MRIVITKNNIQAQQLSYEMLSAGMTSGVWLDEDVDGGAADASQRPASFVKAASSKDSPLH